MTEERSPWAGPELAGVKGVLHLCRVPGAGAGHGNGCVHVSEFVNGPDGRFLADNDLRGFLDGRFAAPWNQAEQSYTRVGRFRHRMRPPPRYGEDELFRTLHRWTAIDLPAGSRIHDARLILHTHSPLTRDTLIYLYAVRRDWSPGRGGVRGDNVSVPNTGEVWWGDARFEEEEWSLPGAGFGMDGHPEADTGAQPLAMARGPAGTVLLEFGGRRLVTYAEQQLDKEHPLLFLLKASDQAEDQSTGSLVKLLSGEYGHVDGTERRPLLQLEWSPPHGADCQKEEVFLEYGREARIGPLGMTEGARLWASFAPAQGFEKPTLQYRVVAPGEDPEPEGWRPLAGPLAVAGQIEVRILAARNPIVLGQPYSARFRDTWVVSAPAEDQRLEWDVTSPTGDARRIEAIYEGAFTWKLSFLPDEIGRWKARWRHRFGGAEELGPDEVFDVIGPDLQVVLEGLHALRENAEGAASSPDDLERALGRLLHLERAGMRALAPETFRAAAGRELRTALDRTREALCGASLPPRDLLTSIALREEAGGRRFREPIPRCSAFRTEDYEPPPPRIQTLRKELDRWRRRLNRRLTRLLRS
jgi:hypothetical protein